MNLGKLSGQFMMMMMMAASKRCWWVEERNFMQRKIVLNKPVIMIISPGCYHMKIFLRVLNGLIFFFFFNIWILCTAVTVPMYLAYSHTYIVIFQLCCTYYTSTMQLKKLLSVAPYFLLLIFYTCWILN